MTYSPDWDIYRVISGSRAYGTHHEDSDQDEKGVCIASVDYYFSPFKNFEQHETHEPDLCVYEIRKFIRLASEFNPNIVEMLYVEPEDILYIDASGQTLLENRKIFLSRKARYTFVGYAKSQLKRMRNHRAWTENPPEKPDRAAAGLPVDRALMTQDRIKAIDREFKIPVDKNSTGDQIQRVAIKYGDQAADYYAREKKYRLAARKYEQYSDWLEKRNRARHATELQFGYDTKHGYHLVRLLRMGVEILEEAVVRVKRPDREELMEIREGVWSYERLLEEADRLEEKCARVYAHSPLPENPNMDLIERLAVSLIERRLTHK